MICMSFFVPRRMLCTDCIFLEEEQEERANLRMVDRMDGWMGPHKSIRIKKA